MGFKYGGAWQSQDGLLVSTDFNGVYNGTTLTVDPQLDMALWIKQRYFFIAELDSGYDGVTSYSYSGFDFSNNTILMGYRGQSGELLQYLAFGIGSDKLSLTNSYEDLTLGTPSYNSPALVMKMQTENSYHEFLMRYDTSVKQTKTFLGEREVTSNPVELGSYRRGQDLVLPDINVDLTSIKVYLESKTGSLSGNDGRKYRRADATDYSVDTTNGLLSLTDAPEGRVLIYYTKGGAPVGSTSLGKGFLPVLDSAQQIDPSAALQDFDFGATDPFDTNGRDFTATSAVLVDGRTALALYSPSHLSVFEMLSDYALSFDPPQDSWLLKVFLKGSDNNLVAVNSPLNIDYDDQSVMIGGGTGSKRDLYARYPFLNSYPEYYSPANLTNRSEVDIMFFTEDSDPGINLGGGVVDGSATVYVNGRRDTTAKVDYSSGGITFSRIIQDNDYIVVNYRIDSTSLADGDLLIFQGNTVNLTKDLSLEAYENLDWHITSDQYSVDPTDDQGSGQFGLTLKYSGHGQSLKFSNIGTVTTSNTTGLYRAQSMDNGGLGLSVLVNLTARSQRTITSLSSDVSVSPNTSGVASTESSLTAATYFDPIAVKYIATDAFGHQTLLAYDSSEAPVDSGDDGPNAAGPSENDPDTIGNVFEVRYSLPGGAPGQWSAGNLLLNGDGVTPYDLSSTTGISFYMKSKNISGSAHYYLQLGETGVSPDSVHSITPEDSARLVSYDITGEVTSPPSSGSGDNGWHKVSILFTSAQRKRLTYVRAIRVVVVSDTGTAARSGSLLLSSFNLAGSPFVFRVVKASGASSTDNLSVYNRADTTLLDQYKNTTGNKTEADDQKVVEVDWGTDAAGGAALATGDKVELKNYFNGFAGDLYNRMNFYMQTDQATSVTVQIFDSDGRSVTSNFNTASSSDTWSLFSILLRDGTGSVTGGGTATSHSSSGGRLQQMSYALITVNVGSGTQSGKLSIDEIFFDQPIPSGVYTAHVKYSYGGGDKATLKVGDYPIVSGITLYSDSTFGVDAPLSFDDTPTYSTTEDLQAGLTLTEFAIKADYYAQWDTDAYSYGYSASHDVSFPASFQWIQLEDRYSFSTIDDGSSSSDSDTTSFGGRSKADMASFNFDNWVVINGGATIDFNSDSTSQQWTADLSTSPGRYFPITLTGATNFSQTVGAVAPTSDNYFDMWLSDFKYEAPVKDGVTDRSSDTSGTIGLSSVVNITYSVDVNYSYYDPSTNSYNDGSNSNFTIPYTFALPEKNNLTMSFSYQKVSSRSYTGVSPSNGFMDDYQNMAWAYSKEDFLFLSPLFYEIFSSNFDSTFVKEASAFDTDTYTPRIQYSLSRSGEPKWYDFLVVPNAITIAFEKQYNYDTGDFYSTPTWDLTVNYGASGFFKKDGVFGLENSPFSADAFTSSFDIEWQEDTLSSSNPGLSSVDWSMSMVLSGEEYKNATDNSLTVSQSLTYSTTDDPYLIESLDTKYSWIIKMKHPAPKGFEKVARKKNLYQYYLNTEEVTLSGQFSHDEDASPTTYSFLLTHTTDWVIEKFGTFSFWGKLGVGFDDGLTYGVEIGTTLTFQF